MKLGPLPEEPPPIGTIKEAKISPQVTSRGIRGVGDRRKIRLEEFARQVLLLGATPWAAARAAGWPSAYGMKVMQSKAFKRIRDEVVAAYHLTREHVFKEIEHTLVDTARESAYLQNKMIKNPDLLETKDAIRLSEGAMDRVGWKAPEKTEAKVEVSLSDDTLRRMAETRAQRLERQGRPSILEADFSYALQKPRSGVDAVKQVMHEAEAASPSASPVMNEAADSSASGRPTESSD